MDFNTDDIDADIDAESIGGSRENENEENLLDDPVAVIAQMKEKKGKAKKKAVVPKYLWTNDATEALKFGNGR